VTEREIEITDGEGIKHILHLSVYHVASSGRLASSMVFDQGKGGHYVLNERELKEVLHLIIDEMK
jgi:hypothetical protein